MWRKRSHRQIAKTRAVGKYRPMGAIVQSRLGVSMGDATGASSFAWG